ncbi:hypothetical protein PANT111_140173 [Pantoea brenneri]|uniref:Uncharacterized protein n=1 Tax=Pantoea brenneri TaxID=472694 RepID=A0AAX3J373_9GAMM|nr:hypothetical protein PANT111_140173 [Pantoea brenneri]
MPRPIRYHLLILHADAEPLRFSDVGSQNLTALKMS